MKEPRKARTTKDLEERLLEKKGAENLSEEEEDSEAANGLSKLERDALLGQAMDFEVRGHLDDAINCYQRAIRGGLKLPAAYFMLGLLYANNQQMTEARKVLAMAAKNPVYLQASKMAINGR